MVNVGIVVGDVAMLRLVDGHDELFNNYIIVVFVDREFQSFTERIITHVFSILFCIVCVFPYMRKKLFYRGFIFLFFRSCSFRHNEFEENTFYCATCSGWFVITQNTSPTASSTKLNHNSSSSSSSSISSHPSQSDGAGAKQTMRLFSRVEDQHAVNEVSSMSGPGKTNGSNSKQTIDSSNLHEERVDGQGSTSADQQPISLLTPHEIYNGLTEYVIGQHHVKIALSVGVHNHYKRLRVSQSRAAAQTVGDEGNVDPRIRSNGSTQSSQTGDIVTGSIYLNQKYGRSTTTDDDSSYEYCEIDLKAPADSETKQSIQMQSMLIGNKDFGREVVETCELDKSNIILIGPTGSKFLRVCMCPSFC